MKLKQLMLFCSLAASFSVRHFAFASLFHDVRNINWEQLGQDIDGESESDELGYSVSLSSDGRTVAIGAVSNDGTNGTDTGHVRVFSFNGTDWEKLGEDIDGEARNDYSGWSVSLSSDGTTVAIGAPYNDGNGDKSGHTRVFSFNGMSWVQLGQDIDGKAIDDQSSRSVSLSSDGRTVAIGARYSDANGDSSGNTRVFSLNGTVWEQLGQDIDGEAIGDQSGRSVSLSADGRVVAIGAIINDANGDSSGYTRVFWFNGTDWEKYGQDIAGEAAGDRSGWSVSLSSDARTVAIGALRNDGVYAARSGHTRVFSFNGMSWVQLGQDIDGKAIGDQSGWSVSLSSDGRTVAIGAPFNDAIGGSQYIPTRIFSFNGIYWEQIGQDIAGEANGDLSGWSVSLSSDGSTVAIGAPNNDGNGVNSGHARVYKVDAVRITDYIQQELQNALESKTQELQNSLDIQQSILEDLKESINKDASSSTGFEPVAAVSGLAICTALGTVFYICKTKSHLGRHSSNEEETGKALSSNKVDTDNKMQPSI